MTATSRPLPPYPPKTAPRPFPAPTEDAAAVAEAAPPPVHLPLDAAAQLSSATGEAGAELAGGALLCRADDCRAAAEEGSVRTIGGERWFTCARGHLNAELIFAGADFRAKSLRNLTVDDGHHPRGASADGKADRPHEGAGAQAPNGAEGLLPYCDIRTLQEAWRQQAKHAERLAVLADRAASAALKNSLAALAEAAADEALLLRDMADIALSRAGKTA